MTGGLAAILASTCCLGPLVLITLGVSGAWISNLTLLEPYQPLFIGAAVVALFFAYRRIWRPATDCAPGQVCALPSVNRGYKVLFWIVVALVILARREAKVTFDDAKTNVEALTRATKDAGYPSTVVGSAK